jgi:hypothetical protein
LDVASSTAPEILGGKISHDSNRFCKVKEQNLRNSPAKKRYKLLKITRISGDAEAAF